MNQLSLASPHRRDSDRRYPPNINVPLASQVRDQQADDQGGQTSPSKRRRGTNDSYIPGYHQSPVTTTYSFNNTPRAEAFVHPDSRRRWGPAPPPISTGNQSRNANPPPQTAQSDLSLTLPPLHMAGKSVEEIIMSIDFVRKIAVLGRISPPLKSLKAPNPPFPVRGAVVAVEGDSQVVVSEITRWLSEALERGNNYNIRTANGPDLPDKNRDMSLTDYFGLIDEWHRRSSDIIKYITTPIQADAEPNNKSKQGRGSQLPVLLLQNYQLFATNAWACSLPINDTYQPQDHWQWLATLWRGIIGPDLTVHVRDASTEELARERTVEVREHQRLIIVRREKGPGPLQGDVDEKSLRRLAFEMGEWIQAVSQERGGQGSGSRRGSS